MQTDVIKITSFYPFLNFLRVTQEFYEDRAITKTKSLKSEEEYEFNYKDVSEIRYKLIGKGRQGLLGFWTLCIFSFSGYFCRFLYANPILLHISQFIYIVGVFLYFSSFIKDTYFIISDKSGSAVSVIKQTTKNKDSIRQIVELLKSKFGDINIFDVTQPFPNIQSVFEHTYFDYSNLEKTTDKFYNDEIVGYQKGIATQNIYKIKYQQLSGEIYQGKSNLEIFWWAFTLFTLLGSLLSGFLFEFAIPFGFNIRTELLYTIYTLFALFILSLPANHIKREQIGFLNKSGEVEYWAYVNKSNKAHMEDIIKFVQSKISEQEKTDNPN